MKSQFMLALVVALFTFYAAQSVASSCSGQLATLQNAAASLVQQSTKVSQYVSNAPGVNDNGCKVPAGSSFFLSNCASLDNATCAMSALFYNGTNSGGGPTYIPPSIPCTGSIPYIPGTSWKGGLVNFVIALSDYETCIDAKITQ